MAARSTLKLWLRQWLGTTADDPAFSDDLLDPSLQSAYDGLIHDIKDINPGYLWTSVTLSPESTTSRAYAFAAQSTPITDFSKWLQVRYDDEEGGSLSESRMDELTNSPDGYFAITGPDDTAVLYTSGNTTAGATLWLQYSAWPALMDDDTDAPDAIPSRYHDVVALECLFVFGNGGEQRCPPELRERWLTRRSQLLAGISRRGVEVSRTRIVEPA